MQVRIVNKRKHDLTSERGVTLRPGANDFGPDQLDLLEDSEAFKSWHELGWVAIPRHVAAEVTLEQARAEALERGQKLAEEQGAAKSSKKAEAKRKKAADKAATKAEAKRKAEDQARQEAAEKAEADRQAAEEAERKDEEQAGGDGGDGGDTTTLSDEPGKP